jgi:hypothetical protein
MGQMKPGYRKDSAQIQPFTFQTRNREGGSAVKAKEQEQGKSLTLMWA